MTRDLSTIIKAYDVRGLCPGELDADIARALGAAFARFAGSPRIVTARDMRESGVELSRAFAEGATSQGVDVVDAGLGSTDLLYYAAGTLDVPGAMFTASHNPARYNGIKLCLAGAKPVGQDTGLAQLRADAERYLDEGLPAYDGEPGTVTQQDLLAGYAAYMKELVPGIEDVRPLKVVVDAGNGMGGYTVPAVFEGLPLETTRAVLRARRELPEPRGQPDRPGQHRRPAGEGRRGRRRPRPGLRRRRRPLLRHRRARRDRQPLGAHRAHRRARAGQAPGRDGDPQPHHLEGGARGRRARTAAPRCAPASATPSSRPRWPAPARSSAASTPATSTSPSSGTPTPACSPRCTPSPRSARRTARCPSCSRRTTATPPAARSTRPSTTRPPRSPQIKAQFADRPQDELDGLTVELEGGAWFNVRASNTEPLLRLNVEAPDVATMERVRDEVLGLIRG